MQASNMPRRLCKASIVGCSSRVPQPDGWPAASRFSLAESSSFGKRKTWLYWAFSSFAHRHPDAVLVTAWRLPVVPNDLADFASKPASVCPASQGWIPNALAWAHTAPRSSLIKSSTSVPCQTARCRRVLRDMDAAIFANRCEGGTNLVAMECLASSVPTILSANTGHLDLVARVPCYILRKQTSRNGRGPVAFEEPRVGRERCGGNRQYLELIYRQHQSARDLARRSAEGDPRVDVEKPN